jgi:tight adherence protein B
MRPSRPSFFARLLLAAGALLAVGASIVAAASAATSPSLTEAAGATYPYRAYVLTLPTKKALATSQVRVSENGRPVHDLSLVSEQASSQPHFAVVLLIDASNSMRGRPIAAAMAAARRFESHRSAGESLAVIAFNGKVQEVLPFTTDGKKIAQALASPPKLSQGTKIYDALQRAQQLIVGSGAQSGSVVLLSDGADVGSQAKPGAVLPTLSDGHVHVYTVGLRSRTFDPATLKNVASTTGGSYTESATPAGLTGIFDKLGSNLSNQYVVNYRSVADPNKHVVVKVAVAGLPVATTSYTTPALHFTVPPPYHQPLLDRVVQSSVTAVIVAVLISCLFGWGIATIVGRKAETVPSRVGQFVTVDEPAGRSQRSSPLSQYLGRVTSRSFERHRQWQRLEEKLSIADIEMTAGQLVLLTAMGTLLVLFVGLLLVGGWGVVLALCVPFIARWMVNSRVSRRRRAFAEQLPENLDVLASSLRAGHSLTGGLAVVVENAPEPSRSELQRALAEERLGVPLDEALKVVVDRMDNKDIDQVALIARLQRDVGSNSAEVLDRVVETVRGRMELRRLVRTLTAQGRFSRWVLTAIPLVLAGSVSLLSPGYLSPLFHHTSGHVLIVFVILMTILGSYIIGRIVNIKV